MYQAAAFPFKYTSASSIKPINFISIYWIWLILEEISRRNFLSKLPYSITILITNFIQEYLIFQDGRHDPSLHLMNELLGSSTFLVWVISLMQLQWKYRRRDILNLYIKKHKFLTQQWIIQYFLSSMPPQSPPRISYYRLLLQWHMTYFLNFEKDGQWNSTSILHASSFA